MQDVPSYKLKIDRYMTNIRRDSRQKVLKQMRQKILFETESIQKIAQSWKLAPKEQEQYNIMDIQKLCCFELVHVGDLLKKIQHQQWPYQKIQAAVRPHVQFWAYYLQEIYTENLKVNEDVEDFFLLFISNTTYKQLAMHKLLQMKALNTLQVGMINAKSIPSLKKKMLKWVAGTEGLTLIYNCLQSEFLSPNQYENVYKIIKQSLNLMSIQKLKQCCMTIMQIMKSADFDDTYEIYTKQSGIMIGLLSQLVRHVQDENISQYANAVIYLMDSYNSLILDYARMGVGLLGVRMLICRRETNMLKGLEIIRYISQVQQYAAVEFLLEDRELDDAGLWSTFFQTQLVIHSRNISIKKEGFTILANIMSNGNYEHLEKLNNKIFCFAQKQIFDVVEQALKNQTDPTILQNLLIMLSILLYYSQKIQQEEGSNPLLKQITQRHLDTRLKELLMHDNIDINQKAEKIMKDIQTMEGCVAQPNFDA